MVALLLISLMVATAVMATKYALKMADYTVTEAGFGADLGAENSSISNAASLALNQMLSLS